MFLTGEFSKISRVSKRLLHHYDDIGLLKPAHTDQETGYRYYSAKQLPHLNRILALKDLGLSLDQIRKMLKEEISDDEINGMLLMKKAEIEETVLEDLERLRRIEARLQQNRMTNEELDVVIKSIPAQPFLSIRKKFSNSEDVMQFVEQIMKVVPPKVSPGVLGSFAGVVHTEGFKLTDNDIDLGFLLKKVVKEPIELSEEHVLRTNELPAVETIASSVQVGVADPVLVSLGNIAKWTEDNGYRITGPYREIVFDASNSSDLEEAVIEIQMPVEKVNLSSNLKFNSPKSTHD